MQRFKKLTTSHTDRYYEQMHQLFLHDRVNEAEQAGTAILKKSPKHKKTLFLLAQIARNQRQYQRARERYHKILVEYHTDTKARLGVARCDYELYKFEDALVTYLHLYEHSIGSSDYLISLGDCYQKLNLHKVALKYYEKAIQLNPQSIKAHLGLGYEHIIDGHYAQAAEAVRKAKELYYANKYQYDTWVVDNIFDLEKHVQMLTGETKSKPKKPKKAEKK